MVIWDMVAGLRWLHEGKNGTATRVLGGMRRIYDSISFLFLIKLFSDPFWFLFSLVRSSLAPEITTVTSPLPGAQELYTNGLSCLLLILQVVSFSILLLAYVEVCRCYGIRQCQVCAYNDYPGDKEEGVWFMFAIQEPGDGL